MTTTATEDSVSKARKQEGQLFRTVLVGVDNDPEASKAAATVACSIADHFSSDFIVVHAIRPDVFTGVDLALSPESLDGAVEQRTAEVQRKLWRDVDRMPADLEVISQVGEPADVILEAARDVRAELIVLASSGRRGVGQMLLGSVSQAVLDRAQIPVLVTGPEFVALVGPWKKVLFATDLDKTGIRAAEYAARLAKDAHGELTMLHVPLKKPQADYEFREWTEEDLCRKLESLLGADTLRDLTHHSIVAYGDPASEILAVADREESDLIVVGIGEHSLAGDRLPWRTIAHLIRSARCAVLNVGRDSA